MKLLTKNDVTITVTAEMDDIPVIGNAIVSGDADYDRKIEDEIFQRLRDGDVWAWAQVTVTVSWEGLTGSDYLGACCYESEEDFRECMYFDDMVNEALAELNTKAGALFIKMQLHNQR